MKRGRIKNYYINEFNDKGIHKRLEIGLESIKKEINGIKKRNIAILRFKYPKTFLLIIFMFVSYKIFSNPDVTYFVNNLSSLGYIGIFLAGVLFTSGLTIPFSIGYLVTLDTSNIIAYTLIGGIGALIGDLVIFNFIRISFEKEFRHISKTKTLSYLNYFIEKHFNKKIRIYMLYVFASIIILSPLPDEIGIIMVAGFSKIDPKIFAVASFVLNSIGIFLLLLI